jgi:hypothetical protein
MRPLIPIMYKYLLLFVLFSPLVGIVLMEQGAYSITLGRVGEPNGASFAYLSYALTALLATFATIRLGLGNFGRSQPMPASFRPSFRSLSVVVFGLNFFCLLFMLFVAGGLQVILGAVSKGEFRTSLGGLGGLSYLITKSITPASLAYLSLSYSESKRRSLDGLLLAANIGVGALIGLSWGFKTAALWVVLPAFLLLFWNINWRQFAVFTLISAVFVVGAAYLFDRTDEDFFLLLALLGMRLTILQGDVSWGVWDLYKTGQHFPNYFQTLLPVVGDRLFELLSGIPKDNYALWVDYHFDLLLTRLAGYTLDEVAAGQSITGTPFAEGVIALGSPLFLLFGIVAGIFSGLNYNLIASAIKTQSTIVASAAATYFCFFLWPWLNGGGVILLFHVSALLGVISSVTLLFGIRYLCVFSQGSPLKTPSSVQH